LEGRPDIACQPDFDGDSPGPGSTRDKTRYHLCHDELLAHFPEIDSLVGGDTEKCRPVTSSVVKFAVDSLLEGDGFELPVPRQVGNVQGFV
jgi:hypothetical protein